MLLVEKLCSIPNCWSNQLYLSKLNGEFGSETSDFFLNHPNFLCPWCTKIFDGKAEVVEHLDTCDGTEDFFAMILLSVMRKLKTISTTATSFIFPPCSFCPNIFKEKAEFIKRLKVQRYKHRGISKLSFLSRNLNEY